MYSKEVDWWSLGCILYEMLTGRQPFCSENMNNLFKEICSKELKFPNFVSDPARDLITRLLERLPKRRLGYTGSEVIKEHPFFKDIDWAKLQRKEIKPPFVPKVGSEDSVKYIDKEFTGATLTDTPDKDSILKQRANKKIVGFTFVRRESEVG